ncbi:unnamed protein product [Gongylonema pulchrum]|uniref:SSD domain-containing protein n=1 Tax=Gongylonema pulchrum TaxID=637853 RepID=A0A183DH37_9BILA|nr:unnamed protein product [Gongylonema pulchrum]
MKQISKTHQQEDATKLFREVAERYPSYNITTFSPLWLFTDQYAIVVPNTMQNILIALLVMIVIAMLLIPQPMCSIWVAFAIASIDLGVIGFMTLWDVNLVKNCFTPKKILARFFKINLACRIKHLQLIRILGQTSFAPSLSSSQLALALRLE